MRGYKTLIQNAELMAMAPEAVAEFLKHRVGQLSGRYFDDPVDEDTEDALLKRSEPLINLALAKYGRHIDVLSSLFQSTEPGSAVRLACLSNTELGKKEFWSFPVKLFGAERAPIVAWLSSASDQELAALIENPSLSDEFLRDLLERTRGFESIDDDKLSTCVYILQNNPRMRTPRTEENLDGFDEYNYNSVFDAAWKLAQSVPVTDDWATALGWLYERLLASGFSVDDPLSVATRWKDDSDCHEAIEKKARSHEIGHLTSKERVRKGLARLALGKSSDLIEKLLASDDIAFRAAAYAAGSLKSDQIKAAHERDGELAFNEAILNLELWKRQGTRQALRDMAWAVANADKLSDMMAVNQFRSMAKDLRGKNPEWFSDEDMDEGRNFNEVEDQLPATKADVARIAEHMNRQTENFKEVGKDLKGLLSRTGWIWWFSLGAFVATLLSS